ncbi:MULTISPECIES: PA2169 family four-helix-bundle protein [Aliiglaciecola]|uniref:PA2169 family four-helix-bundle protein n=1 Tax=Aliiglaciecola TaxID=1406885 RepID=UPI001C0844B0|nr:PA2169 family four-helix-bundle protein [Aliiglaciecola lipolytica]MBU2876526.1 PA2169 family four-helix-bundle protein [Aliiglaciecola lipolytica]
MSNEVKQVNKVADVIEVLKAGADFYEESIDKATHESVKQVFARMMFEKKAAIEALQPFAIAEQGEKETGESIAVNVRNMYTKLVGFLSFDKEHTYISQLEEVEDKTLEVIDEALAEKQPDTCTLALREIRGTMQACHDEMKALQELTA